jgi:uncharacterized protein involved in exopolysaccharide biosynthesis
MRPTEEYLRDLTLIVFARKRIILGTTAAFFCAAVLITLFWPPTYTATGSVLVKSRQLSKSPQTIESTQIRVWEVDLATMTTEMKILTSKELIDETLTELNDQGKLRGGERLDRDSLLSMVDTVMGNITAAVVPASNIIEITLKGKNARDTKVILNELLNKYISFRSGIYNPEKASVFFKGEADTFESGLRSMDKEKLELADAAKSADPALEIQNNLDLRKTLEQQLDTAKQELNNLNLTIGHLEKQLAERDLQFFSSIENPAINLLGAKLQDIYLEKTNLLRTFTPESDRVKGVDEQIEMLYTSLKEEVTSYIGTLRNRMKIVNDQVALLEGRINFLTQRNIDLHKIFVEQQRLNSQEQVLEQSYQVFATRSEEARISSSSTVDSLFSISIIGRPVLPVQPSFPRAAVVIPLGLVIGFILGLSLGFFVEYFDYTFKSPSDTMRYAGMGTLFSIPDWSGRTS